MDGIGREDPDINYSRINRALIGQGKENQIIVINIDEKRVELKLKLTPTSDSRISQLKLFGEKENQLALTNYSGNSDDSAHLCFVGLNFKMRKVLRVNKLNLDFLDLEEGVGSIAVAGDHNHVLMEIWKDSGYCPKMAIFELKNWKFVKKAVFVHPTDQVVPSDSLVFAACYGNHMFWFGFGSSSAWDSLAPIYDYDLETQKLSVLKNKRLKCGYDVEKFYRFDRNLYFIDDGVRLFRLNVSFSD